MTYLGSEADADEAFSQACEDLWVGLPGFEWRASIRTWMYTVARNAAHRLRRSPNRRRRHVRASQVSEMVERARSSTAPHLRTDVKDAFAQIRAALDAEDRALLVLRVDREMDWRDIATVLFPEEATPASLPRLAARLRKRFQAVKDDIRDRARAAGLLGV